MLYNSIVFIICVKQPYLIFRCSIIGGSSRFGLPSGFDDPTLRAGSLQDDWNDIWLRSGIVPEKIDSLPDGRLELYYPSGINIRPNDSVTPGLTLQFPELKWNAVPSAQYTVMLVDVDIFQPDSDVTNFFHYMSINVPGDRIDDGDLIYEYVPPFAFLYNPAQGLVQDLDFTHTMVWMVFRQSGRIEMRAEQNLCSTELFGRLMNHQEFVLKNDLGVPVAGNFLRALYRPDPVYQLLCFFSRCSGRPFPALLEGVNDGPECISDNPAPEGEGEGHSG